MAGNNPFDDLIPGATQPARVDDDGAVPAAPQPSIGPPVPRAPSTSSQDYLPPGFAGPQHAITPEAGTMIVAQTPDEFGMFGRQSGAAPSTPPVTDSIYDPQQYVEIAKGVPQGIGQGAGILVQALDVVGAAMERGAASDVRRRIDLIDRLNNGETFSPEAVAQDPWLLQNLDTYAAMPPEVRTRQRDGLARITQQQWVTNPTPVQERTLYRAGQGIQDAAKTWVTAAPGYENAFGRQVGVGLGTMAFGMGTSMVAGPVGGGFAFAGMGIGESTNRAVEYDKQQRAKGLPGLSQEQIITAGLWGVGPGLTDSVPVEVMLGRLPVRLPEPVRKAAARVISRIGGKAAFNLAVKPAARIGTQAAVEGVQEGTQSVLQDLIAREVYNENQKLGATVFEEAQVGAATGGLAEFLRGVVIGTANAAAGRRGRSGTTDQAATQQPAPPEDMVPLDTTTPALDPTQASPDQAPPTPETIAPEAPANAFADLVPETVPEITPQSAQEPQTAPTAPEVVPAPETPLTGLESARNADGSVTLYRGEREGAKRDPLRPDRAGRWWTSSPENAQSYAGEAGQVESITIPAEQVRNIQGSDMRPDEFVVPDEVRAGLPVSIQSDVQAGVQEAFTEEARRVAQAERAEQPGPYVEPASIPAPEAIRATAQRVVTPDQSMEIGATPQIVELDDLSLAQGALQPRDRSRSEYVQGARERATRLDPKQLKPSRVSDTGAPIVTQDGVVLSGNGRTMSIAEAYRDPALSAQAQAYKDSLGPEAQNYRQPVLIMRAEPLSRADSERFADLSNRGRIAQMSATERAQRDARALGADGVSLYQGGDFTSPQNQRFLQNFMAQAVTAAERPSVSRDGELTQEGAARMRAAILAAAYGDPDTLARMLESTDDNIRSITGGMLDAAPAMAALRAAIDSGEVDAGIDPVPSLSAAVRTIADLRARKEPVQRWLAQIDAFGRDPIVEGWVKSFYYDDTNRAKRREKVGALLNDYAAEAIQHRPGGLFEDETTATDVLAVATRKNRDDQITPLFGADSAMGETVPQGRAGVQGRPDGAGGERSRQGSGGARGNNQAVDDTDILAAIGGGWDPLAREARALMRDVRAYEAQLQQEGRSPDEIADSINARYGSDVTGAEIAEGLTWWSTALPVDDYLSSAFDAVDYLGYDAMRPIEVDADAIVAPMDPDARPAQPQRQQGVAGRASPGPRLTPAMRSIIAANPTASAAALAKQIETETGQYAPVGAVQEAITSQAAARRQARADARRTWTPDVDAILNDPAMRALTSKNVASQLAKRFPKKRFSEQSVRTRRRALNVQYRGTWTPDVEAALARPDLRALPSAAVAERLGEMFPDKRFTEESVRRRRGELGVSLFGGKPGRVALTDAEKAQVAARNRARGAWSEDSESALMSRELDGLSWAQKAERLGQMFPGKTFTSDTVRKKSKELGRKRTAASDDTDILAAVGGLSGRSWLDWLRGNKHVIDGSDQTESASPAVDRDGGAGAGQQPAATGTGAVDPDSARAGQFARLNFPLDIGSTLRARFFEGLPGPKGLRQVRFEVRDRAKWAQSNPSTWISKGKVIETAPGTWTIDELEVRKNKRRQRVASQVVDAIEGEIGGQMVPPAIMTADMRNFWRSRELEGSRWSTTSIDGYVPWRGKYYRPDRLRDLRDMTEHVVKTAHKGGIEQNNARKELREIEALLEKVPPDILAAVGGSSLDLSPAARKARAEAMGFDTSRVWYHVTLNDFDRFSRKFLGENTDGDDWAQKLARLGYWFSDNPMKVAKGASMDADGGRTIPIYIRGEIYEGSEPSISDGMMSLDDLANAIDYFGGIAETRKAFIDLGYKAIAIDDHEFGVTSLVVFGNTNIRSVNATFDPAQERSADLMAASGRTKAVASVTRALFQGKAATIPSDVVNGMLDGAWGFRDIVPSEVPIGAAAKIQPFNNFKTTGGVRMTFRLDDGRTAYIDRRWDELSTLRNGVLPVTFSDKTTGSIVGFVGFDLAGYGPERFRGELAHEGLHVLRRLKILGDDVLFRLARHSNSLGVMTWGLGRYLKAIGADASPADLNETTPLEQIYDSRYAARADYDDSINQEYAAHMLELYAHGQLTDEQVAPVKDILDSILDGSIWRGAQDGAAMEYPLAPRSDWYGEANFRETGGVMRLMSPDEFLSNARPMKIDDLTRENINDLKDHILSGRELDPLQLYAGGKEDGRHRAIAAQELGIERLPVIVFDESKKSLGEPFDLDALVDQEVLSALGVNDKAAALGHLPDTFYHGTSRTIDPSKGFADPRNLSKGNPYEKDSHHGRAIYITSSNADADRNYMGGGPDLTNRVVMKYEQISDKLQDKPELLERMSVSLRSRALNAYRQAEKDGNLPPYMLDVDVESKIGFGLAYMSLHGGQSDLMELRTNPRNPVILGKSAYGPETVFGYEQPSPSIEEVDGAWVVKTEDGEVIGEYASEDDAYDGASEYRDEQEPIGSGVDLIEAIRNYPGDVDERTIAQLAEAVQMRMFEDEGISASAFEEIVRKSDAGVGLIDYGISSGQFLQDIYTALGHDAAIMPDADQQFPRMGIPEGTTHIAVFDNRRLRRTDAAFDPARIDDTDLLAATQKGKTRLSALHNLSAENLIFADKMGGIAVPSIGLVREGMDLGHGFGEITLIGNRNLGDPEKNPTFDADAYTSRFPKPDYKAVPSARAQKLVDQLRPYDMMFSEPTGSLVWGNMVNTPRPDEAVRDMMRSNSARALFLGSVKDKTIKPVMRDAMSGSQFPWMNTQAFKAFLKTAPDGWKDVRDNPEGASDLGRVISSAIDEYIAGRTTDADLQAHLRSVYRESILDEAGLPHFGPTVRMSWDVDKIGKRSVDEPATRKRLERALKPHEVEFKSWVEDQIIPLYGEPRIKVNGRLEPYTLENITRVMTAGGIHGAEKTMTFGEGLARASAASRISSLEEARNRAEWQMAPESEVSEAREKTKEMLEAWRNAVLPHNKYVREAERTGAFGASWDALDGSMRAIAALAKRGYTPSALRQALAREDFTNVPTDVLEQGVEIAKAFMETPVPYFEVKPQRAVSLNEFKGAVIPRSAPGVVREILDRHGIPFKEYGGKDRDAQGKAAQQFTRQLAKQDSDILFAIQKGRNTDTDQLGYYSKALEAARDLPQTKGTPEQMLAQLKKAGVKDAEIEMTGLKALLDAKGSRPEPGARNPGTEASGRDVIAEIASGKVPYEPTQFKTEFDNLDDISLSIVDDIERALQSAGVDARLTGSSAQSVSKYLTVDDGDRSFKLRVSDHQDRHGSDHTVRIDGASQAMYESVVTDQRISEMEYRDLDRGEREDYDWRGHVIDRSDYVAAVLDGLGAVAKFLAGGKPKKSAPASITKAEIVEHLEKNRVALNEVERLSDRPVPLGMEALNNVSRMYYEVDYDDLGADDQRMLRQELGMEDMSETKWSDYSLDPGNPTYRETVLHLPESDAAAMRARAEQALKDKYGADYVRKATQEELASVGEAAKSARAQDFRSGHFPESNIVGHMMTSIVKHEGKSTYLVDQIQSDWGQKLRDGGVRDEAKIAELRMRKSALEANITDLNEQAYQLIEKHDGEPGARNRYAQPARELGISYGMRQAIPEGASIFDEFKRDFQDLELIEAELRTAEAATPGNPLVNTTDQWVNTTLRRALRQAAEADAEYIAIPHGDTVLSYNPGDDGGMRGFYGSRTSEGIVPKNLRKMIEKLDKTAAKPVKVAKLETSQGPQGWKNDTGGTVGPGNGADPNQTGFTLFELTDDVKARILDDGQPLFAVGGITTPGADISAYAKAVSLAKRGADPDRIWDATGWYKRDGKWVYETENPTGPMGAAEAREHAKRSQLSPEERRATPPWREPPPKQLELLGKDEGSPTLADVARVAENRRRQAQQGDGKDSILDLSRRISAHITQKADEIRRALKSPNPRLERRQKNGLVILLTKSPDGAGDFRITRFMDGEPVGHSDFRATDADIRMAAQELAGPPDDPQPIKRASGGRIHIPEHNSSIWSNAMALIRRNKMN